MDQIDIIERLWTKLKYGVKNKYQINSLPLGPVWIKGRGRESRVG